MKKLVRHPALAAVVVTLSLVGSMSMHAQTPDETIVELRALAEQGDADAQYIRGLMYATGLGVPQDDAEAVRWYRLAAEQGLAGAQYNLGFMYGQGRGVPQDDAEAVRWYRLAAEQGNTDAQSNLGFRYATGLGVPQDDAEAVRWYRRAAEQGDAYAQDGLGLMYGQGRGVPQDDAEAVRWFRLAAEQGNTGAQFYLGVAYANGEGVPQDDAEAVRWYRQAAEQGNTGAQFYLGLSYGQGRGVPQDDVTAHMWLNLAASRSTGEDRERAVKARDAVAERLTPEGRSEAQRLAREWQPTSPSWFDQFQEVEPEPAGRPPDDVPRRPTERVSTGSGLPVPSALLEHRVVYLTGFNMEREWLDWAAEEIQKLKRFKLVGDREDAELVFTVTYSESNGGTAVLPLTGVGIVALPIGQKGVSLHVHDTEGTLLWTDEREVNWLLSGAVKDLIRDIHKAIDRDEREDR